jgi:hypothetical protein
MTSDDIVVLTRHERKDRLGHGGVKDVAEALKVDSALVSRVLNGKQRHAGVEAEIARRVVDAPNEVAFPPAAADPSPAATNAQRSGCFPDRHHAEPVGDGA